MQPEIIVNIPITIQWRERGDKSLQYAMSKNRGPGLHNLWCTGEFSQIEYWRVAATMVCYLLHSQLHTSAIRPVECIKPGSTVFCEKREGRSRPLVTGHRAIAIEGKTSHSSAGPLYLPCLQSAPIRPGQVNGHTSYRHCRQDWLLYSPHVGASAPSVRTIILTKTGHTGLLY